jgi:carboxylesterase
MVLRGGEAFYFKGGKVGCLLIHGGTGTPSAVRPLGEFLAREGIPSLGPLLKGFGETPEEWLKTSHQDWISSAEDGLHALRRDCENVFVAGLSMGGTLALYLAGKYRDEVSGVIPICAPYANRFLEPFRVRFLPLIKENLPMPNFSATDLKAQGIRQVGYEMTFPSTNLEWAKIVEAASGLVSDIRCPALIVQARNDHVIDPSVALDLYETIGAGEKELFWLENSYHMATLDVDRELLYQRILTFIKKNR